MEHDMDTLARGNDDIYRQTNGQAVGLAGSADDGVAVHAGFPNPAADRRKQGIQLSLDLNQHLIKHPSSTFVFRISGHHWADQGVFDGDIALIDRALVPRATDLVIIWQASGFSLQRQRELGPRAEPLGVVSAIIHQYRV